MAFSVRPKLTTLLLVVLLLASCITVQAAAPFGLTEYEGYAEGVIHVKGSISAIEVEYNGTIQEVLDQFSREHPGVTVEPNYNITRAAVAELEPRNKGGLLCCPLQNWNPATQETIFDEIIWLSGVTALYGVGARSCVRVSCEWDAAIYLCNDNYYGITPNCAYIASYATDIMNACTTNNGVLRCCGQEFDTDNYNVIVRKDKC